MKALTKQLEREQRLNQRIAQIGVRLVRRFRATRGPGDLQELQHFLRSGRIYLEDRLALLKKRRGTRSRRQKRRFGSRAEVMKLRAGHDESLRDIDQILQRRREILLDLGDAAAWIVLGGQPRRIYSFYQSAKSYGLPREEGLAGPVVIAERAHGTGEFLVIENDLTRLVDLASWHASRLGSQDD